MRLDLRIKFGREKVFTEKSLESYKQEELIHQAKQQFELLIKKGLRVPIFLT